MANNVFPSDGLGTTLQPISAQEGRADDAKPTGCFGKNALTVLHGLFILVLNKEFFIATKPRKGFFIILCLLKVIVKDLGKQVSRRNVFVYSAVYICLGLFVLLQFMAAGLCPAVEFL